MLTIPKPPDFGFLATIHSHGWYVLPPFAWDGSTLHYETHKPSAGHYHIAISQQYDQIRVEVVTADGVDPAKIVADVRWMLGLDVDLSAFYAYCRREPHLQHVPRQGAGRLLRCATMWEDVIKTITTTNTAWSGTKRMCQRLVEHWGSAFPTAQTLAGVTIEVLKEKAGLGYRAAYVHELATAVAAGALDLEGLRTASLDDRELYKTLRGLKGVGDYAASSIMMLLGRYALVPADSIARSMVSRNFYGGEPVTPAQIQAAFADFGVYAGLAYWFWDYEGYDESTN